MKALKTKDLRDKSVLELEKMLAKERAHLYETRRKLVFREIKDVSSVHQIRHNIARILTLITEKKGGGD